MVHDADGDENYGVMMNLMIIINTNMTNSQYDPPYHLGKTRLMMVHDADGDENYGSDDEFDDHN